MPTDRARLSAGRAVRRCAVAAGMTSRANTSRAPVIWVVAAAARPSSTRKAPPSSRTGTPWTAATAGSIEANSRGRPTSASTRNDAERDDQQDDDLAGGDAQEGAEQQAVHALEEAVVEGDEQKAAGEGERLHRADHRRLLAEAAHGGAAARREGDDQGGGQAEAVVAEADAHPEQVAAAAPGKATTESVWPAKVWRRSTMNQPTSAAITATIVPAS